MRGIFHMPQKRLAAELGLSISAICHIENDKRMPHFDTMEAMAELFHCTLNDFATRKQGPRVIQITVLPLDAMGPVATLKVVGPKPKAKKPKAKAKPKAKGPKAT